ncbi:MAG: transcription antitermination factor NusB [Deltaproteobacteria bacterium]|nr:transcription antitermination factor NusB [Deltaproteobacteria bacterium]
MNVRRKARETALQVLYRMDMAEDAASEDYGGEMDGLAEGTEARLYCEELIKGVVDHRAEIDSAIEANSDNWTIARMAIVDRNILRVAVYELQYSDVPYKAAIDEAVELAKKFGSAESGAFINGIVDNVWKSIEKERPARSNRV